MKNRVNKLAAFFMSSGKETYASMAFMGVGQILNGQFGKGILYMLTEIAFILYFGFSGITDIIGFFTLGTNKADAWAGIAGDNSVIMLLRGIFAWIALAGLVWMYISNIKDAHNYADEKSKNRVLPTLRDDLASILDKNFYKAALFLPLIGVAIFNILPIIFMILIAFTNYGGKIVPPELVDWTLDSFKKLVVLGDLSQSFMKILGWNLIWALSSTLFNYFAGLPCPLRIFYCKGAQDPVRQNN